MRAGARTIHDLLIRTIIAVAFAGAAGVDVCGRGVRDGGGRGGKGGEGGGDPGIGHLDV